MENQENIIILLKLLSKTLYLVFIIKKTDDILGTNTIYSNKCTFDITSPILYY